MRHLLSIDLLQYSLCRVTVILMELGLGRVIPYLELTFLVLGLGDPIP